LKVKQTRFGLSVRVVYFPAYPAASLKPDAFVRLSNDNKLFGLDNQPPKKDRAAYQAARFIGVVEPISCR